MNGIEGLRAWWRGRDRRERVMLGAMGLMLAAFAWWYGLLWPLRALRDGAQSHYDRAVAGLQAAEAGAATLGARAEAALPPPANGEALQRRILDSARDAGLAPSRQRSDGGGFSVGFDRVSPPTLFAWLETLRRQHGIAPLSLRVARADGSARAEVAFAAVAP